jgi:hypothetical protein
MFILRISGLWQMDVQYFIVWYNTAKDLGPIEFVNIVRHPTADSLSLSLYMMVYCI